MFKIFEINDCFEEWAISYFLIGAESKEDLIEKLPEIHKQLGLTKKTVKQIIKDEDYRIKEVAHLFTDTPYVKLESYGYMD